MKCLCFLMSVLLLTKHWLIYFYNVLNVLKYRFEKWSVITMLFYFFEMGIEWIIQYESQHLKHYLQSLLLVSYFHISQGTIFPFLCQFFLISFTSPMFHLHNQSNLLFQVLHFWIIIFSCSQLSPNKFRRKLQMVSMEIIGNM